MRTGQDAAQFVHDRLAAVGYDVESLFKLQGDGTPYEDAIPILLEMLGRTGHGLYDEIVVRLLTVPWAQKVVAGPLIEAFEAPIPSYALDAYRWTIGSSIETIASRDIEEDILRLVADERFGDDRQMLVMALGKLKSNRALEMLQGLLNSTSATIVIEALKTLRNHRKLALVQGKLESLASDTRRDVADFASRLLARSSAVNATPPPAGGPR